MTKDEMLAFCEAIDGWMERDQLVWLYEQARALPAAATWVEVGVWKGRSYFAVAAGLKTGSYLYGVDHFLGTDSQRDGAHSEAAKPGNSVKIRFLENLTRFAKLTYNCRNLGMCELASVDAAQAFRDYSVDAVFIDAAHEEASVKADLEAWGRVVKPHGLLCGHDYHSHDHPGVTAALAALDIDVDEPVPHIWQRKSS